MFTILWFLLVTFALATSLVWMLDHNGDVVITWLGYQAQTDILTAFLLAIFFTVLACSVSYLLARILAIKFPNLLKLFFKKKLHQTFGKAVAKA